RSLPPGRGPGDPGEDLLLGNGEQRSVLDDGPAGHDDPGDGPRVEGVDEMLLDGAARLQGKIVEPDADEIRAIPGRDLSHREPEDGAAVAGPHRERGLRRED